MARTKHLKVWAAVITTILFTMTTMAAEVSKMTKEELKGILGNPETVLIDVRTGSDWSVSEFKIKGAVREDAAKVADWIGKYPKDKTLVFYCA